MADLNIRFCNIRYGFQVVRPERLVTIVPTPPETPTERFERSAKNAGSALLCVIGASLAVVAWTLLTMLIQAPTLSGLGGIVIGLLTYMIWSGRRG